MRLIQSVEMSALWFVLTPSCVVVPLDCYESERELKEATIAINQLFPGVPYRYTKIRASQLTLPDSNQLPPAVEPPSVGGATGANLGENSLGTTPG